MKTRILLTLILLSASVSGFCTTWTVTSSGFTFSPSTLTITLGDSVNFILGGTHNATEVSQATWNANGATALPGGFATPFAGGIVTPAFLTAGTHYYVCTMHASGGMKGTITVNNPAGVSAVEFQSNVFLFPNPSNGKFHLTIGNASIVKEYNLEILDLQGQAVYNASSLASGTPVEIDLADLAKGIYLVRISGESEIYSSKIIIQ